MADATYAIPSFHGGEISAFAQGRFDKPDYRISLNVCLNAMPLEIGAWARRPGTRFAGTTRGGLPGRVIKFDFQQSSAVTLEFTDGYLRFRSGAALIHTNETYRSVVAISAATPAVVQTVVGDDWPTGTTVLFPTQPGPILENRPFIITRIDATHLSLADALTGAPLDGSTLGPVGAGTGMFRVHELTTVYIGGSWSGIRAVQAETTDILLSPAAAPQALTVTTLPAPGVNPVFAINPAIFLDGPYLDPFTNGVQANANQKTGVVTLSLSFPAWDATTAYAVGAFVTYFSVNYISLVDQNLNVTPTSSPSKWSPTDPSAAINDGHGFLGTDVGRLVRLFSEPDLWNVATAYAAGAVVSYNPSGHPDETTYWTALASTTGNIPGQDTTHWTLTPQGAAIWTWGKIVSLATMASAGGGTNIGSLSGLAAAFDGAPSKASGSCATQSSAVTFLDGYIGKDYSASAQKVSSATLYPSTDAGFAFAAPTGGGGGSPPGTPQNAVSAIAITMRASATAPALASDGIALGGTGLIANTTSPVTILSNDAVTAWNYVWFEVAAYFVTAAAGANAIFCSQAEIFNPSSTGVTSNGVNVELLGPPLLYTTPIRTWRLGVYSNTTGWPTCGTYDDGRLYLGGAVKNRFDAGMSNGVKGATVNFAPTNQYGAVAANNAITYLLNAKDANQIVWMAPEEGGIVMGTQAGEWLVRAPTTGPIAPNNISARRITKIGAANIEPLRTEHTNIFVHRFQRKLTEYFPDAYSGKFTGPNLADKAGHIISSGIAELAYTSAVTPIIWGRCGNGSLFGITYKRDTLSTAQPPTFAGWHRHALGSGRVIESICSGPSVDGNLDALTMVTNDPATGIRHVEVLTDTPDENASLLDAWYLDSATAPSSYSWAILSSDGAPYGGLTLNGLWHLDGKTVTVFAGGLDCGEFAVSNGSCFVPFGDGISAGTGAGLFTAEYVLSFAAPGCPVVVGFTYNSDGQLVRPIAPADTGARNGPALGKTRRNHQYSMLLSNSLGLSVGGNFSKTYPVPLKDARGRPLDPLTMFSGVVHDTLSDDYSLDGMVCWRVSRPVPAVVVAFSGFIATQDR